MGMRAGATYFAKVDSFPKTYNISKIPLGKTKSTST